MPKTSRTARLNASSATEAAVTNNTARRGARPIPEWQRISTLVLGDFLVFLVFATIGRRSHGEASDIWQIFLTALPFAAGWFLVAPFVGAYRRALMSSPRKMAQRTILAWILSWPVAMALRGLFVDHAIPPATFAAIALITNLILLLVWRWPYALTNQMRNRE
jgi:hypothetical protein